MFRKFHNLRIARITLKGQQILLFDSGIGDVERLLIFGTTQMLTLLRDSNSLFADGTFKVVPSQFFHYIHFIVQKTGASFHAYTVPSQKYLTKRYFNADTLFF